MWCGDTVIFPGFEAWLKRVKPEVVVTHSGGAVWGPKQAPIIMDARQTLKVCRALPNARVIATHLEAFDHLRVSRQDLRQAADSAHVSQHHLLIPRDGDIIEVNL
jgi:L-ascorbate metabolism protein UlaG (beta-lactamase superfamily)